jgi:uncharacterized membrane protein (UPF0136 family)
MVASRPTMPKLVMCMLGLSSYYVLTFREI